MKYNILAISAFIALFGGAISHAQAASNAPSAATTSVPTSGNATIPTYGPINIMQYGAKGDCKSDDSVIINQAIAAFANSGIETGEVYFPRPPGGCYAVYNPILLQGAGISLVGDGRAVSVIRAMAPMDSVLLKDTRWILGDTITDITFDANAFADHAIRWQRGTGAKFSKIEALNGLVDDIRMQDGENFIENSYLINKKTNPPYDLYMDIVNLYNANGDYVGQSAANDSHITNNIMVNAQIAYIYEHYWLADNHFVTNHGYKGDVSNGGSCPTYSYVAGGSIYIGNTTDCATEAAFFVTGNNATFIGNRMDGIQGYGFCTLADAAQNKFATNNVITDNLLFADKLPTTQISPAQAFALGQVANTASGYQCVTGSNNLNVIANNNINSITAQIGAGAETFTTGAGGDSSGLDWAWSYLGFNATRNYGSGSWTLNGDGAHNGGSAIYGDVAGSLYFSTNPSSGTGTQSLDDSQILQNVKMKIDSGGGVSIGTSFATDRLTVNGDVQVGNSKIPCDEDRAGAIRWIATERVFEGCDGTRWHRLQFTN